MKQRKKENVMRLILKSGGLEIRDVDSGQPAFLYSSKNYGPGYVDIKGRIGFDEVFEPMVDLSADKIIEDEVEFDLIVGMMTGGSMPGYRLKQILSQRLNKKIIYIYQRGARKVGGHQELDTGDRNNPRIFNGIRTLIIEELVNFAETTCNGAEYERKEKGRMVEDAATILFYEHPVAIEKLKSNDINLHWAIGLPELLDFALREKFFSEKAVESYREFLRNPKLWNESRGFTFYE